MTPTTDKLAIPEAVELLPCPLCNARAQVEELGDDDSYYVSCTGCGLQQIAKYHQSAAIAAWNRRLHHMPDRGYAEVGVKPLEWRACDTFPAPTWMANTPFGFYEIEERAGSDVPSYALEWHSFTVITIEDSLDEAKAAAQADYEARIRSALVPVHHEAGK